MWIWRSVYLAAIWKLNQPFLLCVPLPHNHLHVIDIHVKSYIRQSCNTIRLVVSLYIISNLPFWTLSWCWKNEYLGRRSMNEKPCHWWCIAAVSVHNWSWYQFGKLQRVFWPRSIYFVMPQTIQKLSLILKACASVRQKSESWLDLQKIHEPNCSKTYLLLAL